MSHSPTLARLESDLRMAGRAILCLISVRRHQKLTPWRHEI